MFLNILLSMVSQRFILFRKMKRASRYFSMLRGSTRAFWGLWRRKQQRDSEIMTERDSHRYLQKSLTSAILLGQYVLWFYSRIYTKRALLNIRTLARDSQRTSRLALNNSEGRRGWRGRNSEVWTNPFYPVSCQQRRLANFSCAFFLIVPQLFLLIWIIILRLIINKMQSIYLPPEVRITKAQTHDVHIILKFHHWPFNCCCLKRCIFWPFYLPSMFKSFFTKMIGEDNQTESSEKAEKTETERVEETKKEEGQETYLESRNRNMQQKMDADMMKEMFIYTHMRN